MGFQELRILVPSLMGLILLALEPRQRVVVVERLVLVGNFQHPVSRFCRLVLILELLIS